MPKIFRPTLKQAIVPAKPVEHVHEEPAAIFKSEAQPVVESPVIHSPEPDKIVNSLKLVQAKSDAAPALRTSPTDLDLDADLRKSPATSQDAKPRVKLFATKQTRRPRTKVTETAPPVDEPLNRSSVTLRSLLNWVPLNKPPPTYRQERLNSSVNSVSNTIESDNNPIAQPFEEDTKPTSAIKTSPDKFLTSLNKEENYVDPLAPQLRLDADGNIVLDESSLVVRQPEFTDTHNLRHVVEETGVLGATYNSFKRRPERYGGRWTEQETVRFYRALATMGTDFYSMEKLFPNRTRPELKRKYKREEKINPYLVNQALRNRRAYDVTALIPLSDEDEKEEEENREDNSEESRGKGRKSATNAGDSPEKRKPNHKFPKIEHRRRRRPPTVPDPSVRNRIMETIDSVLSQTDAYFDRLATSAPCPSTSAVHQDSFVPHEYRAMFTNLDASTQDFVGHDDMSTPIKCNQSLLDRMIAHKEAELAAVQKSFVIEDLNPLLLDVSGMELPDPALGTNSTVLDCQASPQIDLVKLCKEVLGQD